MDLTHPIWYSMDPDNLPFGYTYGFDGCETLSTEIGSVDDAALASFTNVSAKFSIYYVQDFLRKHKMLISLKLRGQRNSLPHFS